VQETQFGAERREQTHARMRHPPQRVLALGTLWNLHKTAMKIKTYDLHVNLYAKKMTVYLDLNHMVN